MVKDKQWQRDQTDRGYSYQITGCALSDLIFAYSGSCLVLAPIGQLLAHDIGNSRHRCTKLLRYFQRKTNQGNLRIGRMYLFFQASQRKLFRSGKKSSQIQIVTRVP